MRPLTNSDELTDACKTIIQKAKQIVPITSTPSLTISQDLLERFLAHKFSPRTLDRLLAFLFEIDAVKLSQLVGNRRVVILKERALGLAVDGNRLVDEETKKFTFDPVSTLVPATAPQLQDKCADCIGELTWLSDAKLQSIVCHDLEEIDACRTAGAHKACMILCGSCLEAILFDVLQQNRSLFQAEFSRYGPKWKERVSITDMLKMAKAKGIVGEQAEKMGGLIVDFRDLVHPNRASTGTIRFDQPTRELSVNLLRVAVKDIAEAVKIGKLEAYRKAP